MFLKLFYQSCRKLLRKTTIETSDFNKVIFFPHGFSPVDLPRGLPMSGYLCLGFRTSKDIDSVLINSFIIIKIILHWSSNSEFESNWIKLNKLNKSNKILFLNLLLVIK